MANHHMPYNMVPNQGDGFRRHAPRPLLQNRRSDEDYRSTYGNYAGNRGPNTNNHSRPRRGQFAEPSTSTISQNLRIQHQEELNRKNREIEHLNCEGRRHLKKQKLLRHSIAAQEVALRAGGLDVDKFYSHNIYHQPDEALNAQAMGLTLMAPTLNDATFITQMVNAIHLSVTGHREYVQASLHPQHAAQNIFSSGRVRAALTNISELVGQADLRYLMAAATAVFTELLRAANVVSIPGTNLPVLNNQNWLMPCLQNLTNAEMATPPMDRATLCGYLQNAVSQLQEVERVNAANELEDLFADTPPPAVG